MATAHRLSRAVTGDTADREERCHPCETRRFAHYGALRPSGLSVTLATSGPTLLIRDPHPVLGW
ncbi:DUF6255 family natural product biosynthesis protein [Streptomyces sp. NPDC001678]|uniref:DUF6255 family natural product biosynthesis protein n=1 Tax=Streptomyces sp. NPDC001678 TaxID=3364599 RepID=UPI0036A870FF